MTVEVVDATGWDAAAWDALAARSTDGHALQSHVWGELKRPLGWTPHRYAFRIGGETVAVASLQERPAIPVAARLALPSRILYAPRGPILLRAEPEVAAAALEGLRAVAHDRSALVLTVDPVWAADGALAARFAGAGFRPARREIQVSRTATIVPLHAEEGAQHALLRDSTASLINKARRAGYVAERIDLADRERREAPLAEFHALLVGTGQRRGFLVRERAYLLAQWRGLGEAGLAHLWFAVLDGRRTAGLMLLTCGRRIVAFQAGSLEESDPRRTRPNQFLHWEVMRWASTAGYVEFDLGGVDSPTAPGLPAGPEHSLWSLYVFKRGLGAAGVLYARAHDLVPNPLVAVAWRLARGARRSRLRG